MRSAYVRRVDSAAVIVREHIEQAENAVKDPEELSGFIDALYRTQLPGGWICVEVETKLMLALLSMIGHARKPDARPDMDKVQRYREKLIRAKPPPGLLGYNPQNEVVVVVDGAHRALAAAAAKKAKTQWYVPSAGRPTLDDLLMDLEDAEEQVAAAEGDDHAAR